MFDIKKCTDLFSRSHKTLFILCGFPYAGKSYIASQLLINQTDVVFVSIDDIFHAHGFDWDTSKLPNKEEWQTIFRESFEQIQLALKYGKKVLYDSTNQTVASRDELRNLASSVGADTKVIYIKTSIEKAWKRWEENEKNPKRWIVSKDLVQQTIDMFEEPTEQEGLIYVIQN